MCKSAGCGSLFVVVGFSYSSALFWFTFILSVYNV